MKTLNISFDDKDFKKLESEKIKMNVPWETFFLNLVEGIKKR